MEKYVLFWGHDPRPFFEAVGTKGTTYELQDAITFKTRALGFAYYEQYYNDVMLDVPVKQWLVTIEEAQKIIDTYDD